MPITTARPRCEVSWVVPNLSKRLVGRIDEDHDGWPDEAEFSSILGLTGAVGSHGSSPVQAGQGWWARQDSNLQPDRYERSALTVELRARHQGIRHF